MLSNIVLLHWKSWIFIVESYRTENPVKEISLTLYLKTFKMPTLNHVWFLLCIILRPLSNEYVARVGFENVYGRVTTFRIFLNIRWKIGWTVFFYLNKLETRKTTSVSCLSLLHYNNWLISARLIVLNSGIFWYIFDNFE